MLTLATLLSLVTRAKGNRKTPFMATVDRKKREWRTLPQVLVERPWLTERYLRRLVAERRIPYSKAGRKLLFDLADLDAFAEASRVEAQNEPVTAGRRAS